MGEVFSLLVGIGLERKLFDILRNMRFVKFVIEFGILLINVLLLRLNCCSMVKLLIVVGVVL